MAEFGADEQYHLTRKALGMFESALGRLQDEITNESLGPTDRDGDNSASEQGDRVSVKRSIDQMSKIYRRRTKDRQRKVVFELCQKSFELKQITGQYSLYRLSRIWIYGKDEKYLNVSGINFKEEGEDDEEDEDSRHTSEDMCTTDSNEVTHYSLPPPSPSNTVVKTEENGQVDEVVDEKEKKEFIDYKAVDSEETNTADVGSDKTLLRTYLPHWKQVKKDTVKSMRKENSRFRKSFDALKTMYISSQNKT